MREILATVSHDIWSHWMRYMFSRGIYTPEGNWILPVSYVERWKRQMNTNYRDLSEKEKDSDREQADKIIKAMMSD